jgi:hypothetical protein
MYDTAGIKDWITASIPTSDDENEPEDGTGAKASKRIYTTSDLESCYPSKRRRKDHRLSDPHPSIRPRIVKDVTDDEDVTSHDAEATPQAALSGRLSQSAHSAPSLEFGVLDTCPPDTATNRSSDRPPCPGT